MGYYKRCDCGAKNIFESRGNAPRKCISCGRNLLECLVHNDNDTDADQNSPVKSQIESCSFTLKGLNGEFTIPIPTSGGVVGRESLGSAYLKSHKSISRKHIKVSCRGKLGLMIEDVSKYGTFINDERLVKQIPKLARPGDTIKLYDFPVIVNWYNEE